jgi:succinate dehydrogenase/fumarate reductase flavoprotein subunit
LLHPPYYAVQLEPGAFGTRGGPLTNEAGQVRSAAGGLIPGLYAAGNAMASVFGMAYPGGGATLGAAFTYGYLAGKDAAGRKEGETGCVDGAITK